MNENEVYSIPSEIDDEIKLIGFITINTVLVFAIFLYLGFLLKDNIYPPLQLPFLIYNSLVSVALTFKSRINGQKRIYQSVLIYLTRNNNLYVPIENPKKQPDTLIKYNREKGSVKYVEPEEYY